MLEEKVKRKKKLSRRRIQKYHRISSEKQSVDVQPKESKEAKDPGQPVRAAPFHAKKKIEIDTGKNTKKETEHKQKKSRLNQEQKKQGRLKFAEKKTDRILSGEPVAVKRIAQATMQSTETKEKQSDTDMISEKLTEDAMVLTESGGAFLQKEIQRGKQYSFRRKKLKKSKEYEEKESKVHFEEGASKQKTANTSKQQVNQFWKRKRQKAAYEEAQAGTRGTVQGTAICIGNIVSNRNSDRDTYDYGWSKSWTSSDKRLLQLFHLLWTVGRGSYCKWSHATGKSHLGSRCQKSDCATWNKGCDEWSGIYRRGYGGFCALWSGFRCLLWKSFRSPGTWTSDVGSLSC